MNKALKIAAFSIPPLAILGFVWNSNRPRPNFTMGPSRFDTEYYPVADFDFDRPVRNTYAFGLHFGPNADTATSSRLVLALPDCWWCEA
jgi:hypothetical protein